MAQDAPGLTAVRPISINQMATQIKAVIADFGDMMANRNMLFPKRLKVFQSRWWQPLLR